MRDQKQEVKLARAELLISFVLRYGVLLCAFVIALGVSLSFIYPQTDPSKSGQIAALIQGHSLQVENPTSSPSVLLKGSFNGDPETLITVGLLLLIGLPIVRVGLTILVFLFERDWAFVAITTIVFSVLISGIIMGSAL